MAAESDVVVRQATMLDAADLARVYMASAQHHARIDPAAYRVPDAASVTAHYQQLLGDASWVAFLAERDDAGVVGSVEVRVGPDAPGHSMLRPRQVAHVGISILPRYQGEGVGRRLMAEAERWAAERDAEAVLLDMLTANLQARRFYESLGYREFGTLMMKQLDGE